MDDDRVEDTRVDAALDGPLDGVALREDLPKVEALFRLRTLRVKDGNRVSILFVMLWVADSTDRRLLDECGSDSWLK